MTAATMARRIRHARRRSATALLGLLALLLAALAGPTAGTPNTGGHGSSHFIPGIAHSSVSRLADASFAAEASGSSGEALSCQQPGADLPCYGPAQIRRAYGVQPLLDAGITGKGRWIVIVAAYQSPTIVHDLGVFDRTFGLPDPILQVIAPQGLTPFDPANPAHVAWAGEITLDVEWAHVVAPGAGIRLVLARSDADADVLGALRYAVDGRLGDVVSMSYGEAETCLAAEQLDAVQHRLFSQATAKRMTLVASSGNTGAGQPTCDGTAGILAVQTPASDPLVTAVGGTNLTADLVTGEYQQERAWADGYGLSGGGLSSLYEVPAYQGSLRLAARGIPDVAYNAGIVGGVLGYWSSGGEPGFYVFGGTSSGAPQWAGIAALTGQQAGGSLGEMNPSLYRVGGSPDEGSAFNDIVRGDNRLPVIGGYQTRRGWDLVTGWGTPRADRLVPLLAVLAEEVATASGSPPPAR